MKLSELKLAIREMIIGELTEGPAQTVISSTGTSEEEAIKKNPRISSVAKKGALDALKTSEPGTSIVVPTNEASLNEFAAFYKIKDDVDKEEAKAAIDKAIKDNPGQKNLQLALRILKDEEKVNFEKLANSLGIKSVATFNNQDSRKVLDGDLAPFISSARLKGSEPVEPGEPKEPKEKGAVGRPKGSKKQDDSIAFTMGGDVKVVGKTPTKAFVKRALKAADLSQPKTSFDAKGLRALGIRDLDGIDTQIQDLSADLESKLARAKEIAAKGSTKQYTPEEAEFMDDLRAKTELRKKLKASREAFINKKIKKQDLDIDIVSTDED
jgi:hypothetical protein